MSLASELGLPVATSRIQRFEEEVAIVVERYDRAVGTDAVSRVHQEDLCQALSIHPVHKYENEGGPGAIAIIRLLRDASSRAMADIETFVSALGFSWLIGGTEAHAKNYSLLIGAAGRARLAPLYDLASALAYPELPFQKLKLAMQIGGKYRLRDIGRYQWGKLAREGSLDPKQVLSSLRALAAALPAASRTVLAEVRDAGLDHPILDRLHAALCERAALCAAELQA